MTIDDRLRAASQALKDSSIAQVDAATPLREILLHTGQPVTHGRGTSFPDAPQERPEPIPHFLPAMTPPRPKPPRLAIAVNLLLVLLVLAVGIVLGRATAPPRQDVASTTPNQAVASTTPAPVASTAVTPPKVHTQVPAACVDTAELADQVIARLNRNIRDQRLFLALRDYTVASQKCRRAASP